MPTRLLPLVLLPAALFASASHAQSGPDAAMAQFVSAFNAHDAAGVADAFHMDGKLLPSGMPMVTGREAIQSFWQGSFDAGLSHIDKQPIEVVVSGDLAVQTSSYVVTFNDEKVAGKDTLVWQRSEDGQWHITSDIWADDQ